MPIRRARCGRCQAKSADNTGCCKGERRQWRKQRNEAGAAVAECEGLLPPKHDAGTATRYYRAFWQRRCRAAAAGAVLKPQGGNCAVLPLCVYIWVDLCMVGRGGGRLNCLPNRKMPTIQVHHAPKVHGKTEPNGHKKEDFLHGDRHNRTTAGKKHNALLKNCKIIQNFLIKES